MRPLLLLAALALAGCGGVNLVPERTDTRDPGGSVILRAAEIAAYDGRKRFPDGFYCASACTMWLGYERTCVSPRAIFGFHDIKRDYTGIAIQVYRAHLRAADEGLLDWFNSGPNESTRMTRVSGAFLIERGWARQCPA